MKKHIHLPQPPRIQIEEQSKEQVGSGFLSITRRKARFHVIESDETNAQCSEPTTIDVVKRVKQDAVAILPFRKVGKEYLIYLKSCVRPAIAFRDPELTISDEGNLWEVPAGLIEPFEQPIVTAKRELFEEMGFYVSEDNIHQLGHPIYPSVGLCGETVTFFVADLLLSKQYSPTLDGSPMEEGGAIYAATLDQLTLAIEAGDIMDSKTEIAIRRFKEKCAI